MDIVMPNGESIFKTGGSFEKEFGKLFGDPTLSKSTTQSKWMSFKAAVSQVDMKKLSQYPNLIKCEKSGAYALFPAGSHHSNPRICGYVKDGKIVFTGAVKSHGKEYSKLIEHTKQQANLAKTSAKKTAKSVATKATTKASGKAAVKAGGKGVAKSIAKKIPGVSLLAGLLFGAQRAIEGDWTGAGMEVTSGAAGTFPGLGTAASVGIDATLIGRDMANER